jgi:hypothetical protein
MVGRNSGSDVREPFECSLGIIECRKSMMKTKFEKAKRTVWQCGRLPLAALLLPSAIALGQTLKRNVDVTATLPSETEIRFT